MCSVSTMDLPSITHTVRVLVPPSIAVFPNETRISVKSGERVEMSCNSKGIPTPTVSWKRHVSHSTKKEVEQNLELLSKVASHSLFPSNVVTDSPSSNTRHTRHTREHNTREYRERTKQMMEETWERSKDVTKDTRSFSVEYVKLWFILPFDSSSCVFYSIPSSCPLLLSSKESLLPDSLCWIPLLWSLLPSALVKTSLLCPLYVRCPTFKTWPKNLLSTLLYCRQDMFSYVHTHHFLYLTHDIVKHRVRHTVKHTAQTFDFHALFLFFLLMSKCTLNHSNVESEDGRWTWHLDRSSSRNHPSNWKCNSNEHRFLWM